MQKKVLFISHNAGRTGAPLMLLNLLTWLKENTDLSFEILLRSPGSLQKDFAALAPTYLYQKPGATDSFFTRVCRRLGCGDLPGKRHHDKLIRSFRTSGVDLIYSNTITNGDILETLAPLSCPVLTHVHELDYWIEMSGKKNLDQVLKYSNFFIAASGAVKANLIVNYAFPANKVDVVHSFIPARDATADSAGVRKQLGIPEEAFIVLGSGHETWRKGKDLFILLAAQMQSVFPERETHFIWVGGWQKEEDRRNILHDVQHLGLAGKVHLTGAVTNPLDYFAAGDVFAMVSREDPFPLVCLEAAVLGRPILCFADAGGMPEFVEEDAGCIVPYLDISGMAKKITGLARDSETCKRLGQNAARKVLNLCDVSTGSQRISEILCDRLESNAGFEPAATRGEHT